MDKTREQLETILSRFAMDCAMYGLKGGNKPPTPTDEILTLLDTATARREAANEVIEKIREEIPELSPYLDSLSNQYKENK